MAWNVRCVKPDRHVAHENLGDLWDLAFRVVTTVELTEPAFDLAVTYGIEEISKDPCVG